MPTGSSKPSNMPARAIFEYATIRVVPRVERGEYINVGVILFSKSMDYLDLRYEVEEIRLNALFPGIDVPDIRHHMNAFQRICRGDADAGPIAQLDKPSRFRWLTAKRSTIIQTSDVHPGLCTDPVSLIDRLFEEQVGSH
jgi:Protein of unknown function (DUF3037)